MHFYCVILLFCIRLLDCSYNYSIRGEFATHSSDNRFVSTMIFYTASRSDAKYIKNPAIHDLFLSIYDQCDEKQCTRFYAEEGWLNEVSHFGDSYDMIQIDTMWPMILEHVSSNQISDSERDLETDRINTVIITSLLPHLVFPILHVFFNNFLSGLITTVAQRIPILIWYSFAIYFIYLVLFCFIFIKNRKSTDDIYADSETKKRFSPQMMRFSLIFSGLTLLSIVFNVALVSSVIFCQTRYTIYNMPLFYMSGYVMLLISISISRRR